MKNALLSVALAATIVCMPACCVFKGNVQSAHELQAQNATACVDKTVALVNWAGVVGTDEDGDPEIGEVDPDKDPKAKMHSYCAATWVSHDVMLTAFHCIDDLGKPEEDMRSQMIRAVTGEPEPQWDPTGQPLLYAVSNGLSDTGHGVKFRSPNEAFVLAIDPGHDLALVQARPELGTNIPRHSIANVASETAIGERVTVVGHPAGLWWTVSLGNVSQFRPQMINPHDKHVDMVQVSAAIWMGNSGGGAFNDEGELLGVASFLADPLPNVGFFVAPSEFRPFLVHNRIIKDER